MLRFITNTKKISCFSFAIIVTRVSFSIIAYDYKPKLTALLWTWLILDLSLGTEF